jgi:hypothetical protein
MAIPQGLKRFFDYHLAAIAKLNEQAAGTKFANPWVRSDWDIGTAFDLSVFSFRLPLVAFHGSALSAHPWHRER